MPNKLEVFLWLALRKAASQKSPADKDENLPPENPENDVSAAEETDEIPSKDEFAEIFEQLNEREAGKFKSILADYQAKSAEEKEVWETQLQTSVGTDESFIDENVHWSHIEEALRNEIPVIQEIVINFLPSAQKTHLQPLVKKPASEAKKRDDVKFQLIEKNIRRVFARRFVALQNLPKAVSFDRLNSAQLVRLFRLAGIREVTFACAQIEAVESVAAFLRRFSTEDARAIATQLNNLPRTSDVRLSFAETLVQKALEAEPLPAAMLDLLGIWITGILLCESSAARVNYTKQKLPMEFARKLPEIIETQRLQTSSELQTAISGEVEHLAETILKTTENSLKTPRKQSQKS